MMSRWIDVNEKLPEPNVMVLGKYAHSIVNEGEFLSVKWAPFCGRYEDEDGLIWRFGNEMS